MGSKRVFIAEKPELGRAIAEALGSGEKKGGYIQCGNDVVTWCFGHLLTLTDPEDHDSEAKEWQMSRLPMSWPISHKPLEDKESQIKLIQKLIGETQTVYHVGDPDDQGQLLVDELLDYVGNKKPVKRILINDLNMKIVKRALSQPRDNREFRGLYQSALGQSIADQRYGYNLTRAYTLAGQAAGAQRKMVFSVGRVQTPILGLVVRRDREHESHKSHFYHIVTGAFVGRDGTVTAQYQPSEQALKDDKGRLTDKSYADSIVEAVKGRAATVVSARIEEKQTPPPLPYNLLNLQSDASRKFGLSPDRTLKVTQSLREKHKLITYNRSDCEYLSDEQHEDAADVLKAVSATAPALGRAAQAADPALKSRAYNSEHVSAHHAIIPTQTSADLAKLSEDEARLYQLIARAFIAQHFPVEKYRQTTVNIDVAGHAFKVIGRVQTQKGWKALYTRDADNEEVHGSEDDSAESSDLEWAVEGTNLTCQKAEVASKETQPPKQYTMATLMKDLARVAKYVTDPHIKKLLLAKDAEKKGEHGGIGTAATRSAIIDGLFKRGYLEEKGKKVISTQIGRSFHDQLPEAATRPDMTALWHEQQEQIKAGKLTLQDFLDGVNQHIAQEVERVNAQGMKIEVPVGFKCEKCAEGTMSRIKGKKGFFWSCSNYPECTHKLPDNRGKPGKPKSTSRTSDIACPECGKALVRRQGIGKPKGKGKKGTKFDFYGCSSFPNCKASFETGSDGQPTFPTSE